MKKDKSHWNRNILCVDDEEGILHAYRDVFSKSQNSSFDDIYLGRRKRPIPTKEQTDSPPHFNLFIASSGEEAIHLVLDLQEQGHSIAAAFIDMKMPGGIDGLETMKQLLDIDNKMTFAVVTAYTDRSIYQIGSIFNQEDQWLYLNKPFTRGELLQAAFNLTSAWNLRRESQYLLESLTRNNNVLRELINNSTQFFQFRAENEFIRTVSLAFCAVFQGLTCQFMTFDVEGRPEVRFSNMTENDSREILQRNSDFLHSLSGTVKTQDFVTFGEYVIAPLIFRNKLMAVLVFLNRDNIFGEEEELIRLFLHHIAIALKNNHLFHRLENMHHSVSQLEQKKSRFIALASHELRTPLVSLKGYADMMHAGELGELSSKQVKAIRAIKENADRLNDLTAKILQIARMDIGKSELKSEYIDIGLLIDEVISELKAFAEKRKQTIQIFMSQKVPMIAVDADEIRNALIQLLLNAIKFTPDEGQITVIVATSSHIIKHRGGQKHVLISIRDTGIGIAPEEHDRIFSRFYEVRSPQYHSSGTYEFMTSGLGIGLAIVKKIIDAHNGSIWLRSDVGKGTVFYISLPISEEN